MAIRAWLDGDLRLAVRLLQWANPNLTAQTTASNQIRREANLNLQAA
jgi:hypothetical protein